MSNRITVDNDMFAPSAKAALLKAARAWPAPDWSASVLEGELVLAGDLGGEHVIVCRRNLLESLDSWDCTYRDLRHTGSLVLALRVFKEWT